MMNADTIITVKTSTGDCQVVAVVIGQFGIHEILHSKRARNGYSITHLASGLRFSEGWTHEHVAVNLAKRLNERFDLDRIVEVHDGQGYREFKAYLENAQRHLACFPLPD